MIRKDLNPIFEQLLDLEKQILFLLAVRDIYSTILSKVTNSFHDRADLASYSCFLPEIGSKTFARVDLPNDLLKVIKLLQLTSEIVNRQLLFAIK